MFLRRSQHLLKHGQLTTPHAWSAPQQTQQQTIDPMIGPMIIPSKIAAIVELRTYGAGTDTDTDLKSGKEELRTASLQIPVVGTSSHTDSR